MTRIGYLSLFTALASLPVVWADDPVVFRSDVALVRVDAQVVDRDNRTITGLGPRDFVLRESGKPQTIQAVDAEKSTLTVDHQTGESTFTVTKDARISL